MKLKLDKWQQEALAYDGDLLLCTGRRVGKTMVLAQKAVEFVVKKRKPVVIVSMTEDQAMIILQFALNYARETYPQYIGKKADRPKMKELTFIINKQRIQIIVRPVGQTGDAVRGFEGGALAVDEASRMPLLFWIAAKPILLTMAGQIWMASTPFGKQGYFWDKFDESYNQKLPKSRFKVIYISTPEVINSRELSKSWTADQKSAAIDLLEKEKHEMTTIQYGQEYLGLFLDELRQFFPYELIDKITVIQQADTAGVASPSSVLLGDKTYLGIDVASMGRDENVLFAVSRKNNKLRQIDMQVTKKVLLPDTVQNVKDMDSRYKFHRIYVDDGGMGLGVFQPLLIDDQTKRRVVAINNASRSLNKDDTQRKRLNKEVLYFNLLRLMEQGDIELFKDDRIKQSLASVQYENAEGQVKFFGKNTHITEALVRAAWGINDKSLNIWVC